MNFAQNNQDLLRRSKTIMAGKHLGAYTQIINSSSMTNKSQSSSKQKSISKPLPSVPPRKGGAIRAPEPMDVLSGRGGAVNSHEGNKRFRELVNHVKAEYLKETTRKNQKTQIAANIVWTIRNSESMGPGRFLKEDPETGMWYEIGDKAAFRKTGQALREGSAKFIQSCAKKEKASAASNMVELASNQHYYAPAAQPQQTYLDTQQPQLYNLTGVDVVAAPVMPTDFQSAALVTD